MTNTPQEESQDFEIIIEAQDREEFKRLDLFLVHKLPQFSRSTIKRLFEDEQITSPQGELELKRLPPVGTVIEI